MPQCVPLLPDPRRSRALPRCETLRLQPRTNSRVQASFESGTSRGEGHMIVGIARTSAGLDLARCLPKVRKSSESRARGLRPLEAHPTARVRQRLRACPLLALADATVRCVPCRSLACLHPCLCPPRRRDGLSVSLPSQTRRPLSLPPIADASASEPRRSLSLSLPLQTRVTLSLSVSVSLPQTRALLSLSRPL